MSYSQFQKMDPEIKKLWISALRSKKYSQTQGSLHDNKGFCCLGVLCHVLILEEKIKSKWKPSRDSNLTPWQIDGCSKNLPNNVRSLTKISTYTEEYLIDMNDMDNSSFEEIADFIEGEL